MNEIEKKMRDQRRQEKAGAPDIPLSFYLISFSILGAWVFYIGFTIHKNYNELLDMMTIMF